jgi:hypothetical protein
MKKNILILLLINAMMQAWCQEADQTIDAVIEAIAEEILESSEETLDISVLTEHLFYMAQYPLDINQATKEDFFQIGFLSAYQINNLWQYRQRYGPINSFYELQVIDGFDRKTIRWMAPFFKAAGYKQASVKQKRFRYFRHELLVRGSATLQQQKGYIEDSLGDREYLGSPVKNYFRYTLKTQGGEIGLTADKDAGEPFLQGQNSSGYDFYSGHVFLEDLGPVKAVALGDYSMNFGQGLTLWNGFTTGKSPQLTNLKKYGAGLRPYRSSMEWGFFRGLASTIQWRQFSLTAFVSHHKGDGNRVFNADSSCYDITSIRTTGYHRTFNEMEDKNSFGETLVGGRLAFEKGTFRSGITYYYQHLNRKVLPSEQPYLKYRFTGSYNQVAGLDMEWTYNQIELFGEFSVDRDYSLAYLIGAQLYMHPRLVAYILHRHYSKDYNNYYGAAIGEYSQNNNETGILLGMRFLVSKDFTLTTSADFFNRSWISYRTDSPSRGQEFSFQLDWVPNETAYFYLRVQSAHKMMNISSDEAIQQVDEYQHHKIRGHLELRLLEQVSIKNRMEVSQFNGFAQSKGWMVYQDIRYTMLRGPLQFTGRFAAFDTDDYQSRIYTYENDVLYAFSFPALYDKGYRIYLLTKASVSRKLTFWMKLGHTVYTHGDKILSGFNEIDGNHHTTLTAQIRLKF